MGSKVVIVGGVAGGASAAARLRRLDEFAQIVLFEKGDYISFANCGLPYYIGDIIKEKDKLLVQTPQSMKNRFNIDVRVNSEVLRINTDKKYVEVMDLVNGEKYEESYDKLVISTGAEPFRPRFDGMEETSIFTLRNIPDTLKIREFVDLSNPLRAVVIGAGYVGMEMAENLHARGLEVSIVEMDDHVIGPIDFEMAAIINQHLDSKKIGLHLNTAVKGFKNIGNTIRVVLDNGEEIETDMVILAIGVKPESSLASAAGLKMGETGGIWVDEYMCTSNEDIYAVGDAVEVMDFISQKPALIPLAGPANKQGRIAANNICGLKEKYTGTQGTAVVKVFDLTVAASGANEKKLSLLGIEYEKSITHSASHATYYPGSSMISIKLLFAKATGKLLGAQAIGCDGVDKRMDVLATAIRGGMTVNDLEKLELSYAPPFSSAKDPVNMAGYVASNIVKGDSSVFHYHDVANVIKQGEFLLDVRTKKEFEIGTIEGAINIPVDILRDKIEQLPKSKCIYVFCQVGLRGYVACRILKQFGFEVKNLSGGYRTYQMI